MSAQLSAYGRLGQEPKSITTQSGKPMAVGSLAVTVPARGDEDATLWLGVVAFGSQAETLLSHAKGDMVSVTGRAQLNRWTDKDGHDRWTTELSAFWASRVADVKYRVEQKQKTTGKRRGKDGRARKAGVAGADQGKHRRRLA